MTEPISDRESFENAYYYFILAVTALAGSLEQHQESFATEGLAWELRDEVEAGAYLFNCTSCNLSVAQRSSVMQLIANFQAVPLNVEHPSWVPLRRQAQQLIEELQPITRANREYLGINTSEI